MGMVKELETLVPPALTGSNVYGAWRPVNLYRNTKSPNQTFMHRKISSPFCGPAWSIMNSSRETRRRKLDERCRKLQIKQTALINSSGLILLHGRDGPHISVGSQQKIQKLGN
ncbi:hypothetical protein TNIN_206101 [Trichonephila inaurata madagascariensis]|uniref:Uncharacterized protein n=1 Tax=Trichonephila inaurata madagascariensis TaxID=2747483 RepID=A0A8X6JQL3_9ARAC|nr:hypothetical protein TNIN_206101 [Trichonephila inaurata madagascariensis]